MVAKAIGTVPTIEKKSAEQFLNKLKEDYGNETDLRVIDYLPAWTLIIINPNKRNEDSVIYVELATYNADAEERPTFKVTSDEKKYFNEFLNEFNDMLRDSRPW